MAGLTGAGWLVGSALVGCQVSGAAVVAAGEGSVDPLTRGAAVFFELCAGCHGPTGQGNEETAVPPLVGADALPYHPPEGAKLRDTTFATAADVFGFTHVHMPLDRPGSLSVEEHWAVVVCVLHASGLDLGGEPLSADTAAGVRLRR